MMKSSFRPHVYVASVVFAILLSYTGAIGKTIYVDDNAGLGGNGVSWETAYKYLQDALREAVYGDEIRIAGGTYTPDMDEAGISTAGDRRFSFVLSSGISVYGGYAGIGTPDPDYRDIDQFQTIVSGDLNGNDEPDFVNHQDNSWHVLTATSVDSNCVLDGLVVSGGHAIGSSSVDRYGGGLRNNSSELRLVNCIFRDNWARYHGGGISNTDSNVTLENCNFENNAAASGGGIHNMSSSPVLRNCVFSGNTACSGGGIYNRVSSSPTLEDCVFTRNLANRTTSSVNYGGGMYNLGDCNPHLKNCVFNDNKAIGDDPRGGGIYGHSSIPVLSNCEFNRNAARYGGAVYIHYECEATFKSCKFNENHGNYEGGCIRAISGNLILDECVFLENTSHEGGGIYVSYLNESEITNCVFRGNSASTDGGAVFNYNSNPNITACIFEQNTANSDNGGGIYSYSSDLVCTRCKFLSNTAMGNNGDGGGAYVFYGSTAFYNCVFIGNAANVMGGGLYNDCCDSTVNNCTFANNSAVGEYYSSGGGIRNRLSDVTVTNSILWGNLGVNGANELGQISNFNGTVVTKYCCIQELSYSNYHLNIGESPMFINLAGPDGIVGTLDDDVHLLPSSPCIDAGNPDSDFANEPEPDGGRVNMGAYGNTAEATSMHGHYIDELLVVNVTRIGRTTFSYELAVRITNRGDEAFDVILLTLIDIPSEITVADGRVTFDWLAPGATADSVSTFTVEIDRSVPVDITTISWQATFFNEGKQYSSILTVPFDPQNPGITLGDLDKDKDVDLDDYIILEGCFSGPGSSPKSACSASDLNRDGSVDLLDFARMQIAFSELAEE